MRVDEISPRVGSPVRVALVGCTGLIGDIILRAVTGDDGIDVVADLEGPLPDELLRLEALEVDLVLWNDADEMRVARWMAEASSHVPRLLATFSDGRNASLWQLTPRRIGLGEPSADTLLATIRDSFDASGRS